MSTATTNGANGTADQPAQGKAKANGGKKEVKILMLHGMKSLLHFMASVLKHYGARRKCRSSSE